LNQINDIYKQSINYNTNNIVDINTANVGDIVSFGNYPQNLNESEFCPIEWIVVQKDISILTMVSLYAIDNLQYHREYTEIDWAGSDIRKWLNGLDEFAGRGFLDIAFDSAQRQLIVDTAIKGNGDSLDSYSCSETVGKIYLLSTKECEKFFGTELLRKCKGTDYAKIIKKCVEYKMKV